MNVLFDHQIFSLQKFGGISRYFYELIRHLNGLDDEIRITLSLRISSNYYLTSDDSFNLSAAFIGKNYRLAKKLERIINQRYSVNKLKKNHFDLIHVTYYNSYFIKYLKERPYVVTVHDMVHEKFSNEFPLNDPNLDKESVIKGATKVIAISQNTREDLEEIYGIEEDKIRVIHHGYTLKGNTEDILPHNYPTQYILFVGSRKGYKNFEGLCKALPSLFNDFQYLELICAGGGGLEQSELLMLKSLGIESRVKQFTVDDHLLSILYSNAILFVFPSRYEGFGLPILESFACNTPVVCSNTSSLPEVGGGAPLYFDPNDTGAIESTLNRVIVDRELRDSMIKKGNERLSLFSWENTAKKTLEVYREIL